MKTGIESDRIVRRRDRGGPCVGCDVVTVPVRQGLEAVDILRRGDREAVGPVLHDDGRDTLGFLVPAGTAADWDVPGSTCSRAAGAGRRPTSSPPPDGAEWLLPPRGVEETTDPVILRAALGEAARLIRVADDCGVANCPVSPR
ncbi:hypothetical protein AAH978_03800 [Streptomyces sp. ZYX-F-203]